MTEDAGYGESCSWGRRLYRESDRRLAGRTVGSLGLFSNVR